jgi:3'(2'), 5'-bisphosphate nucleotidase
MADNTPDLSVAIELAGRAGKKIMEFYNSGLPIEAWQKEDKTLLTQADLASSDIIMKALAGYPECGIIGEETADDPTRQTKRHLWIFDPLDGTSDFKKRTNEFSVMIAYVIDGEPVLGVVHAPALGKTYFAEKGHGAWVKDNRGTRSLIITPRSLEESIIVLSRKEFTPEQAQEVARKYGARTYIQSGSFGVKVGLIVEGKADFYINNDANAGEWDSAAPQVILEAAGGKITDYDGAQITYNKPDPHLPRGAICSTGPIHASILQVAEQYAPIKPRAPREPRRNL